MEIQRKRSQNNIGLGRTLMWNYDIRSLGYGETILEYWDFGRNKYKLCCKLLRLKLELYEVETYYLIFFYFGISRTLIPLVLLLSTSWRRVDTRGKGYCIEEIKILTLLKMMIGQYAKVLRNWVPHLSHSVTRGCYRGLRIS